MIMEHVVDLFGLLIMWHIDAVLVVFHLACHYVGSVLNAVITLAMISTCFVLKQAEHVIVVILVL